VVVDQTKVFGVNLVAAIAEISFLQCTVLRGGVQTIYDILANQQPVATPDDQVFIHVRARNIGSDAGTLTIEVLVDGLLLYSGSWPVAVGADTGIPSVGLGSQNPFTMPNKAVTITVNVGHL